MIRILPYALDNRVQPSTIRDKICMNRLFVTSVEHNLEDVFPLYILILQIEKRAEEHKLQSQYIHFE